MPLECIALFSISFNSNFKEKLEKISTKSRILQERVDLKRSSRTGSEQLSNVNSKIFSSLSNEKLHNETPTSIHSTHGKYRLSIVNANSSTNYFFCF